MLFAMVKFIVNSTATVHGRTLWLSLDAYTHLGGVWKHHIPLLGNLVDYRETPLKAFRLRGNLYVVQRSLTSENTRDD